MGAADFLSAHAVPYAYIFVRVSGIFALMPILSMQEIPMMMKGWLAAGIAIVIYPLVAGHLASPLTLDMGFLLAIVDHALIGVIIGLILLVYYTAFLMAGEFYSLQIGFGIINVMDPLSETSIPILGQLKSLFALMVFTIIDGHHLVIEALIYSFQVLPGLTVNSGQPLSAGLILAIREMFIISFQMAAPVMGTMFLVELVMGIMSKVAPQMNVMVVGFQIKIVAGMFLIIMILPTIYFMSVRLFDRSFQVIHKVLETV